MENDLTEIFVLIILSMLAGGAIVQHDGMKGLSLGIIGILLMLMFYGGRLGLIIGIVGILIILYYWFTSSESNPDKISKLYARRERVEPKIKDEKNTNDLISYLEKHKELSEEEIQSWGKDMLLIFKKILAKKHLEKSKKRTADNAYRRMLGIKS
ncbi:hypothetical protein COY15_01655 [Candidatus Roizmanbacteria bacterium CG_4_10_14_0_2_um_filter_39_12]|nr:MAG: hypothetical protein COY15_01655 [Candidatus Roizmanbacteria bacterium CG_4_10_14_0_2_um_filter_39_12]